MASEATTTCHHDAEVALVLVSPSPSPSSPSSREEDDAVEERTLGVTYLERDPTRAERRVRAGGSSQAGRRGRLRVPRGHSPMMIPSVPLAAIENGDRTPGDDLGREQMLRISVGGLTLRCKISPPLPVSCRSDDPPLERQFGSLRADGVAVQLRFAPCVGAVDPRQPAPASSSSSPSTTTCTTTITTTTTSGEESALPTTTSPTPTPAVYRLLDGAFTADQLTMDGRIALAAAGTTMATTMRDALLVVPAQAPRAGRSPEVR